MIDKAALVALVGILAAGCAAAPRPPSVQADQPDGTAPLISQADAKRQIIDAKSRLWKDPESIRDASIATPASCSAATVRLTSNQVPASCVCVELNAKNSYGGYTGLRRTVAVFPMIGGVETLDGAVLGFAEYCQDMKPFPELNGSYRPAKRP